MGKNRCHGKKDAFFLNRGIGRLGGRASQGQVLELKNQNTKEGFVMRKEMWTKEVNASVPRKKELVRGLNPEENVGLVGGKDPQHLRQNPWLVVKTRLRHKNSRIRKKARYFEIPIGSFNFSWKVKGVG